MDPTRAIWTQHDQNPPRCLRGIPVSTFAFSVSKFGASNPKNRMIRAIELANVRVFKGPRPVRFSLPRLAVFCGTNSAGKSTVVKVPLLLRQSQGVGEAFQNSRGLLRLVGNQVDLGTYASFVSSNDTAKDVEIGLEVDNVMPNAVVAALRTWRINGGTPGSVAPVEDRSVEYRLNARFIFGLRRRPLTKRSKRDKEFADSDEGGSRARGAVLKQCRFELSVAKEKLLDWQVSLVPDPAHAPLGEPRYEMLFPTMLLRGIGWLDLMERRPDEEEGYSKVPAELSGILPSGLRVRLRGNQSASKGQKKPVQHTIWPLPYAIGGAIQDLEATFRNIHYLGPLRAPAKRYYVAQNSVDPDLDPAGEFLPYVLKDRGHEIVSFTPPGEVSLWKEPLAVALDRWMMYLRTGEEGSRGVPDAEVSIATTKEVLIEFGVRSAVGGSTHALADSGFGYSQLLPILVRGLLANVGSTIIVEQPELHLNPAIQVRLAEFFVGLANAGKQVVLETHSEHIVNAMRVQSVELGGSAPTCAVFFLDSPQGVAQVHELQINEDGSIANWPRSFFGESASLRARLLRGQKRFLEDDSA